MLLCDRRYCYTIRMKRKRKEKKGYLRRIARLHLASSLGIFFSYLFLSLLLSPDFLFSDVRTRFRVFADEAITVTARVLGPPETPIVSVEEACEESALSVRLDWADADGSVSFDITRDGLPLISDLSVSSYEDESVSVGDSYVYVVTAYGPMGSGVAVSEASHITLSDVCGDIAIDPSIEIVSFDGRGVDDFSGTLRTDERRPRFSGTTNIPNGIVSILIRNSTIVSAQTDANVNGYFSWRPPLRLDTGNRTAVFSVVDPNNPSRTAESTLSFRIEEENEEREADDREESDEASGEGVVDIGTTEVFPPALSPTSEVEICPDMKSSCVSDSFSMEAPVDFRIVTETDSVLSGRDMTVALHLMALDERYSGETGVIRYSFFDEAGRKYESVFREVVLDRGVIRQRIGVPGYLNEGMYVLRAELLLGSFDIVRETQLFVEPFPFLDFGGGHIVTFPDFLHHLGTVAFWALFMLLVWIGFFFREYVLFVRSVRYITEHNLSKRGFFGEGEGVNRK